MSKIKMYEVRYRAEVQRVAIVEATSPEDARKKFDDSYIEDETEIDCYNIDDVCIDEIE